MLSFPLQDKVKTARQDLFFLFLFPILYTIFNICYWVLFLSRSKIYKDDIPSEAADPIMMGDKTSTCSCAPVDIP